MYVKRTGNWMDPAILEGIRAGEAYAFHVVHREFWRTLFYFAYKRIGSIAESQDIAANAFTKLFLNRHKVENTGHMKELLFMIVRNECIDVIRFRQKWRITNSATGGGDIMHHLDDIGLLGFTYQGQADNTDDPLAVVHRAVQTMPEKMKQAFELFYIQGLTSKAVAKKLGVTVQTALNHKSASIIYIKKRLKL